MSRVLTVHGSFFNLDRANEFMNGLAALVGAKAKIEICAEVIERQDAEIKRVKECPKCVYEYDGEITEYCVQCPCSNFKTVEQIKVEAYKEFAERLCKDRLQNDPVVIAAQVELKEMVVEEVK